MKHAPFLLLAFLTGGMLLAQDASTDSPDEVLKNSTFSDGTTYWHGDCKPASSDMTTDFTSSSSASGGMLVELHSSSWTKVTQELRSKSAPFNALLTITYQVSSDFKLSDRAGDYGNCGPNVGFGGANIPSQAGNVIAFVDVPPISRSSVSSSGDGNTLVTIYDDHVSYAPFAPSTAASPQTATIRMHPPGPTPDSHQTFCLAFPPGSGSITITKISMTTDPNGFGAHTPRAPNP